MKLFFKIYSLSSSTSDLSSKPVLDVKVLDTKLDELQNSRIQMVY